MPRLIALTLTLVTLLPSAALAFERVSDRAAFLDALAGKQLTMRLYGLSLTVGPDGSITGRAVGSPITGSWTWQDGFFCREMDWSGTDIPYNCQLVERDGEQIRFIEDRGAGDDAVMRLR